MISSIYDVYSSNHKINHMNGLFATQNILVDTKFEVLSLLLRKLWHFSWHGCHLGGHLEFWKTHKVWAWNASWFLNRWILSTRKCKKTIVIRQCKVQPQNANILPDDIKKLGDRWRSFCFLRSTTSCPHFLEKRKSLFFDNYLKLPKTIVKPYLPKVGHGIMVLDPIVAVSLYLMELTAGMGVVKLSWLVSV